MNDLTRTDVPSQAELIALLDEARDYGPRTHEQVVREVIDGLLLLRPGFSLPVIVDAATGYTVKGTGRPPMTGVTPQQAAIARFRERGVDYVDEVMDGIIAGVRRGDDWHWHKLFLDFQIGKVGEVRGGDEMAKAMQMLIARMDTPDVRTVEIIDG